MADPTGTSTTSWAPPTDSVPVFDLPPIPTLASVMDHPAPAHDAAPGSLLPPPVSAA